MIKKIVLSMLLIMGLTSCNYYKKITYLQNLKTANADSLYKQNLQKYKLQPADILYINVSSIDEESVKPFILNIPTTSALGGTNNPAIVGYSINSEGYIDFPVVGKIKAAGFTSEEVKQKIQETLSKFISDVVVKVKLLSFKVSILGEVRNPGQFNIFNDKANIYEVISLAGDLTYYGNHTNVLIMRQTEQGVKTFRVDLTDKQVLTSDMYFIQPNDVIYVEPLKRIGLKLAAADYSLVMTTITATLTTIVLILNFKK